MLTLLLLLYILILEVKKGVENMDITNLKELRNKRDLTQLQLAKLVGVTLNTYANWEKGANEPNEDNMKTLIEILEEVKK